MPTQPKTDTLTFTCDLTVPPATVYHAFTKAYMWRDWFCQAVYCAPKVGGMLYWNWPSGYYSVGTYTKLTPNKLIAFTWQGRDDKTATAVRVSLSARKDGTRLKLEHSGLSAARKDADRKVEVARDWYTALENLVAQLQEGKDLRILRRPLFGIIGGDALTAEKAQALGVPAKAGFWMVGVGEGSSAALAGFQADDVLVRIGTTAIRDWPTLGAALGEHRAGEAVPVVYYRGATKRTVSVTLGKREMADLPATPFALAEIGRESMATFNRYLEHTLDDVSETRADYRPAPQEWTLKELMAHFIACERDLQAWIAEMLREGNDLGDVADSLEFRPNMTPRLAALVARYPTLAALRAELDLAQAETLAEIAALPQSFWERKTLVRRLANWLGEVTSTHQFEHDAQLILLKG